MVSALRRYHFYTERFQRCPRLPASEIGIHQVKVGYPNFNPLFSDSGCVVDRYLCLAGTEIAGEQDYLFVGVKQYLFLVGKSIYPSPRG